MQKLTTIHVSTQRGWHGGEEQARLLIQGLAERGHRCLVLARQGGQFAERLGKAGIEVVTSTGSGRSPAAMWRTRRWLQAVRPDVLHFHDPHALSGAGLAAWGLPNLIRVVTRRVDFPIRSVWRYRNLVNRVVAISEAVADVCRASGINQRQLRVVRDGVDPRRARSGDRQRGRKTLGMADDIPLLLCVATLTDHKGHCYLLDAMPAVLRQFPRVRLLLAGDGELREALENQVRNLGIEKSVEFLGYRSDIPDLLHGADLFVLASHMEGLCTTLIDAALAQLPIVATRAGGIPEVLDSIRGESLGVVQQTDGDRPVGKLVPPRNPIALAAAINEAFADVPAMRAMAERACARAESMFTAEGMVDGNLAVYQELLSTRAGNRSDGFSRRAA